MLPSIFGGSGDPRMAIAGAICIGMVGITGSYCHKLLTQPKKPQTMPAKIDGEQKSSPWRRFLPIRSASPEEVALVES